MKTIVNESRLGVGEILGSREGVHGSDGNSRHAGHGVFRERVSSINAFYMEYGWLGVNVRGKDGVCSGRCYLELVASHLERGRDDSRDDAFEGQVDRGRIESP